MKQVNKLPSEIQWQLVNHLLSSELNDYKCSDYNFNSNNNYQTFPNFGISVFNNEFLGKALAKFWLRMGQCNLINTLNSERENLRPRPLTILYDETVVKTNIENDIEINECQDINVSDKDNKILDKVKSNSSITKTDIVEMGVIGNINEKSCMEFQDKIKKCENIKLISQNMELVNQ